MELRDTIYRRCRGHGFWLPVCAVLAALQTQWAGYGLGVGNQSIQLTFLMHLRDPVCFARDDLLSTLHVFPGLFFPLLARLIPPAVTIETAYRVLHFATALLTLLAAALLATGLTGRRRAGWFVLLLMAAGHHRGLSESGLYALGFTHTGVAIALGASTLALAAHGRFRTAFLTAGIMLHVHALHGAFIGLMLGAWSLAAFRRIGWRRMLSAWLLGAAFAAPAVWLSTLSGGTFDDAWVGLLRLRSAHHVFPSLWWQSGDPQIPRLAVLIGFAALAWGLRKPRRPLELAALLAVPVLLAVAGTVFTEFYPVAFIMRLQLFRSSVFLVLLLLVLVAHGLDAASRLSLRLLCRRTRWPALAAVAVCSLVTATVALPACTGLGPAVLLLAALTLLAWGRLPWPPAMIAGLVLVLVSVAAVRIDVPLLILPHGLWDNAAGEALPWPVWLPAAIGFALLALLVRTTRLRSAWLLGSLLTLWMLTQIPSTETDPFGPDAAWADIQRLTEQHTPVDARILTPTVPGGFRIRSRRAVVAEWRDGTQQFFDPAYAERWWARIERIRGGDFFQDRSRDLHDLPDEEILNIAAEMDASHIVLPASRAAQFVPVARNDRWILHRAEPLPPPPAPEGFANPAIWAAQEEFLRAVVWPNVERYRKRDVTLHVRDAGGQPLSDAVCRLVQTGHRFGFGSSLPHFVKPSGRGRGFRPPLVDPRQLPLFLDLLNYSVIAYSGKWDSIEPKRGQPDFSALDAYIDWCHTNSVAVEYHFVTGYPPAWLRKLPAHEQKTELLRHANTLIDRYGDRVAAWQIVNERQLIRHAPEIFQLFRERLPNVPLGISHCSRFYSKREGDARLKDLTKGFNDVEWLREKGVQVDYFGYHGHRPFPLWADLRTIYEAFDFFQQEGLRVRVTEFGITPAGAIEGGVRSGNWTPALHAEYYRLVYLTAFSHPTVDAINIWGIEPRTWMAGAGLLNDAYEPKPVYEALRRLIKDELHTRHVQRVPLDGVMTFRGFHGPYRLTVELPDGPVIESAWHIEPGPPLDVNVTLTPARDALSIRPASDRAMRPSTRHMTFP